MKIVIIGNGNFGTFLHGLIPKTSTSELLDARSADSHHAKTVINEADCIVLAVPFVAYEVVMPIIAQHIRPETLLVDVCSVKVAPITALYAKFPKHTNWLMTHPLFGPQSAAEGTHGLQLIVCEQSGKKAEKVVEFCKNTLQLEVIHLDAEAHDVQMVTAQSLTFFVSEVLSSMDISEQQLMTPSYKKLLALSELASYESRELLQLFQKDNSGAASMRTRFTEAVSVIDQSYTK